MAFGSILHTIVMKQAFDQNEVLDTLHILHDLSHSINPLNAKPVLR